MKRILMVAPSPLKFDLTQDDSFLKLPFINAKSFLLPLHIATIAGLTPLEQGLDLWDESVQGPVEATDAEKYDLVGITGYTAHLPRAVEISRFFREKGILTAVGGAGISTMPHQHRNDFDVFFIGEAELTWPQFLKDLKKGAHRKIYRQIALLDLASASPPRWDGIAHLIKYYHIGAVQTSRGCPFNCEFCDVSYLFGERFRHKPIQMVLDEVSELERRGVSRIVFCDDNFVGNPKYSKELLKRLIALNDSFRYPMAFASEMSINIASDEELLDLLAAANFIELFIGIESPNKESLKEMNKLQNFRSNLLSDIRKIQSRGMSVRGSLIVGFDHDDKDIFERQYRFVQESCVTIPSIRVLMAPPGTRLWKRLQAEGRIIKTQTEGRYFGNPGTTNIVPKTMTRMELHSGYLELIRKVYDWESFAARIKGFISNIEKPPKKPSFRREWKRLLLFTRFLIFKLDKRTRGIILDILYHTLKHVPYMIPRIVSIISRQYGYAVRPKLSESVGRQIELEKSGKVKIVIDEGKSVIPEGFPEFYRSVFSEVYRTVHEQLTDRTIVNDVLVETYAEFLSQTEAFGETTVEDGMSRIMEIAEQHVKEKNSTAAEGPKERHGDGSIPFQYRESGISDRLLKAIEQELLVEESSKMNRQFV